MLQLQVIASWTACNSFFIMSEAHRTVLGASNDMIDALTDRDEDSVEDKESSFMDLQSGDAYGSLMGFKRSFHGKSNATLPSQSVLKQKFAIQHQLASWKTLYKGGNGIAYDVRILCQPDEPHAVLKILHQSPILKTELEVQRIISGSPYFPKLIDDRIVRVESQTPQVLSHVEMVDENKHVHVEPLQVILMERIQGGNLWEKGLKKREAARSLAARIREHHPEKLPRILGDILHAMASLHAKHYTHGDAHPGNYVTTSDCMSSEVECRGKLIDFGNSCRLGRKCKSHYHVAWPEVRAPEIHAGFSPKPNL